MKYIPEDFILIVIFPDAYGLIPQNSIYGYGYSPSTGSIYYVSKETGTNISSFASLTELRANKDLLTRCKFMTGK